MSICYSPGSIVYGYHPDVAGTYEISLDAEVLLGSTPGAYKTVLFSKNTLQIVKVGVSSIDGSYAFTHLKNDSSLFFVVAFDALGGTANMGASDTLVLTEMVAPDF